MDHSKQWKLEHWKQPKYLTHRRRFKLMDLYPTQECIIWAAKRWRIIPLLKSKGSSEVTVGNTFFILRQRGNLQLVLKVPCLHTSFHYSKLTSYLASSIFGVNKTGPIQMVLDILGRWDTTEQRQIQLSHLIKQLAAPTHIHQSSPPNDLTGQSSKSTHTSKSH